MASKRTKSDQGSDGMEAMAANAVDLLKKDHRTVSSLFKQFEATEEDEEKVALAQQICTELTVHATIEERLFYPAARESLDEESEDLVDEAAVEHRSLKMLIAEINGSAPGDKLFDANVSVLKEYVEHHVKEEEREMFPKLQSSGLDLESLGAELAALKADLMGRIEEPRKGRAGSKARVRVPEMPAGRGSRSRGASSRSKTTAKSTSGRSSGGSSAGKSRGRSGQSARA